MPQSILRNGVVHAPDEIQVEQVLPWLATQRAGFDLGQIQVAQRECGKRPEQCAWNIARGKHERGLPFGTGARLSRKLECKFRTPQKEETREILSIVFNGTLQNSAAVILRRQR